MDGGGAGQQSAKAKSNWSVIRAANGVGAVSGSSQLGVNEKLSKRGEDTYNT